MDHSWEYMPKKNPFAGIEVSTQSSSIHAQSSTQASVDSEDEGKANDVSLDEVALHGGRGSFSSSSTSSDSSHWWTILNEEVLHPHFLLLLKFGGLPQVSL